MADYSVDVKVKLDVQEIQNAVNAKPITATIVPKITFNNNIDGNKDLKPVKDAVQRYFQEDSNRVGLRFKEDEKFLQRDLEKIQSQINKVTSINIKTQLDDNFKQFKDDLLNIQYLTKDLKSKTVRISFDTPSDSKLGEIESRIENYFTANPIKLSFSSSDLESIKTYIEEYFINNPVNLNISGTASTSSNTLEETKDVFDEEKNISIEHYKELKLEHQKYLIEKREAQDKSIEESKQKQKELSEETKNQLHEEIESHKQAFNEKHNNLLEYAEQTKNVSQQLSQEIEQAERDALSELQNALNANNVTEVFKQETEQLIHLYKQGTIDFASFSDDMLEKMKKAQENGLVPDDVIQKIKKKYDEMSLAHQQSLEKQQQQAEKIREKEIKDFENQTEKEKKLLKEKIREFVKQEEDLYKAKEDAWNKEAKNIQDRYNKELITSEEYVKKMQSILPEAFENGYKNAQTYANKLEEVQQAQNKTLDSANNLNDGLDNIFSSLMQYFGVTKIFGAIENSFQKMVQEVRDLDIELTEFSKVTDLSEQETEKFIDSAYRLGDKVARTGTEVVKATTLFKKMGYEIGESMKFAEDALMWTNVADGMVGVDDAATMLISTMKAFEEQGVSSTHVIDALNEVSNNYSTSSSALSENLSVVAATLATSGTSFEQMVGLMTAGIEIMPDRASKVANGLKTISQRIRQIDGDTADKLDTFFGEKGISRFDEITGQLRGTYDILYDVSKIWGTLTENEKQFIGETMAGKNQITVLNALMMNFSTAINATETALNSAGSAARENERVLDSIQGHIQRFQSAFEELSRDLISSDLFKNVVDVGTFLIKVIDVIASNPLTQTGFFLLISMLGSNSILNNIEKIGNRIGNILSTIKTFPFSIDPISLGITAIIAALGVAYNIIHKSNEEVEQARQNIINARKEEEESIDSKIKKYEELQKKYNLENLTHEEQIEILRQINELNEGDYLVHGNINEEIRLQNEKLYIQKSLLAGINEEASKSAISFDSGVLGIKDATRSLLDLNESVSSVVFDKSGKIKYTDLINSEDVSLNIKKDTLQGILDALNEIPVESRGLDWLNIYDTVSGDLRAIEGEIDDVNKYAKDAVSSMLQATGRNIKTMSDEELEDLKKQIDGVKEKTDIIFTITTDADQIYQLGDMIDDEITARAEAGATNVSKATDTVATSLADAMAMMNDYISNLEILNQAHMEFVDNGEISAETLRKIADAGLEAYLIIDEETKSLDVNRDAFMDDNKSIEDNAIASYVAGQRTQFLADVKAIATNAAYDSQTAQQNEKAAVEELTSALADENTKVAESIALKQAQNEVEKEGAELTSEQLAGIQARVQSFVSETRAGVAALRELFSTGSTSSGRTGTNHSVSHGSGSSSSRSSTSSSDREAEQAQREAEQAAKNAQKAWKDSFEIEYKKLKTYLDAELITHEEYYDALEELNKHFFEGRAEFEEEYWKYQDEIIKGRKKYLEDELENYFKKGEDILKHQLNVEYITEEEYYDALTLLYETYYTDKEKYEEEYWKLEEDIYKLRKKQIKELEDELSDLYDQIEDLHKEYIKSLEEDNEELETVIGYAVDVLDEEIEKLKAEKTALSEANQALEEQIKLQELEDALEKAKQKKIRVYRKGQGFVYEQDTKAVGEAQSAIDEYKKELAHKKQLSMIDEEIAKLEEYKKAWKDITESYKRSQNEMTAVGVLGENAREKILVREYNAVDSVGIKYESVQARIEAANNATIDNLEEYIGDETTAGTFSYEIKRIKDKINEIQNKTVTLQVNTSNSVSNIQNIIDSINSLKNKLEQGYSTNNLTSWLNSWKTTIYQAYLYSQQYGITPSTGNGGSGSGSGSSSSGSSGYSVGDSISLSSEARQYIINNYLSALSSSDQDAYLNRDLYIHSFDSGRAQIGTSDTALWWLPESYLTYSGSSGGSGGSSSSGGEEYTEPVYGGNGQIIGYNHYDGNGNLLYYEAAHAQGTLGTTTRTFRVNEDGMEAIVTPEGTVVSAPSTGYGVIKNEYTERLTDFASDPMNFLNKTFSGYTGTYQNNPSTNEVININGNLNLPNVTDGQSFVDSIRNVALQYTTRRR